MGHNHQPNGVTGNLNQSISYDKPCVEYGINSTTLRNSWNCVKQWRQKVLLKFLKPLPRFKKSSFETLQVRDKTLTLKVVDSPTHFIDALNDPPLVTSPSHRDYSTELDPISWELQDMANVGTYGRFGLEMRPEIDIPLSSSHEPYLLTDSSSDDSAD